MANRPCSSETTLMSCAGIDTCALLRAAPDGSVTVPAIAPVEPCATACFVSAMSSQVKTKMQIHRNERVVRWFIFLSSRRLVRQFGKTAEREPQERLWLHKLVFGNGVFITNLLLPYD